MQNTKKYLKIAKESSTSVIEKEEEFNELNDILSYHDKKYSEFNPEITDGEYDELYFLAKRSEENNKNFSSKSTSKVSSEKVNKKVIHPYPLLSLDKVNNIDDLESFLNKFNLIDKDDVYYTDGFIVEYKIDGLSGEVVKGFKTINNGELTISTRGDDGTVGNDITNNLRYLFSKSKLDGLEIVARGEAVINDDMFSAVNKDGKYMNSRNLVSGTVQAKESQLAEERGVDILLYNIENYLDLGLSTEVDMINYLINVFGKNSVLLPLDKQGKLSNSENDWVHSKEDVIKIVKEFSDEKRSAIPYTIDGLVIKPNNLLNRDKIGFTGHHPKHSMAYKFKSADAITELEDIVWQIGSTGQITPVAKFKPVVISGTNNSSATLANPGIIKKLGLMIGDTILVSKQGDVIPKIIKVFKDKRDGSEKEIEMPDNFKYDGENIFSTIITEEQLLASFARFTSKKYMNIKGLSKNTLAILSKNKLINLNDFSSLYNINESEFVKIDGLGQKKWNNLIKELDKSKNVELYKVLAAMNVRGFGRTSAKLVLKHINNFDELIDMKKDGSLHNWLEELKESESGLGEATIQVIEQDLLSDDIIKKLKNLEKQGVNLNLIKNTSTNTTGNLQGKKIVVTGKTTIVRDELKNLIESAGGKLTGSISKNTDYLVSNEKSQTSKSIKAEKLGVSVITEDDLIKLIK